MSEIKTVDIRGLLDTYEFPCKLPGSEKELLIRPITTGQMKKVVSYENENDPFIIEEVLDKLITSCVVDEDFDVNQLYLQDRFALLLEIRKVTKGDNYQFNYDCRECGVENIQNVMISELPVKPLNFDNNIIKINDKLKFEVDFPTRGDQKDSVLRIKNQKMTYNERQVEVQTGTLANAVRKVHTSEGIIDNISFEDKMYILDNIPSDVFKKFSDWFVEHEFGIEFKSNCKCVSCGNDDMIEISLSDFFV